MPHLEPYRVTDDTWILPSYLPVPGLGLVTVNSYLILSREPVLVDTGMPINRDQFMGALWSLVDPKDLRWIYLTHDDSDHTGCLRDVMAAAPQVHVICPYIGFARIETTMELDWKRMHLMNPGESFDVGDRELGVVRPPVFDSPATQGLYDSKTGVYFSADAFGAFIPSLGETVDDIPAAEFAEGFQIFNYANHPWIGMVDRHKFGLELDKIRKLDPQVIASCHAPLARGRTASHLEALAAVPGMEPVVGPNQTDFEALMAEVEATGGH